MQQAKKNQSKDKFNKTIPSFKDYMRQFPPLIPEQIMNLMKKMPTITFEFVSNLQMVKLYRPGLGTNLQGNWVDIMSFVKKVVSTIHGVVKKVKDQCEARIDVLIKSNNKYQRVNAELRDRIERLQTLRTMENGELDLASIQTQSLKKQINSVYSLLQKDMKKILDYLANIENSQESETSNSIFNGLQKLATSIQMLEVEKTSNAGTLSTMNELIKSMARNSKMDSFTQVEESQLEYKAKDLFPKQKQKMTLQQFQKISINVQNQLDKKGDKQSTLNQLKIKDRYFPQDNPKRGGDKPWTLPPLILIFLENMSKQNQNGRVLPWEHVKKTIQQIYLERLMNNRELINSLVGTAMTFEQYFVVYFIKKYNIRRLAEVKMLQLIISLKYYSKFWQKAEMFCYMLDIMRFQPSFQLSEANTHKMDIYAQHFYWYVFSKLYSHDLKEMEEGGTYVSFKRVKVMIKKILFFTDDFNRSRLSGKLQKTVRKYQDKQYVDYDLAVQLFVDEFFCVRKKIQSALGKIFSKATESIQGYFSLKEITHLFKQLDYIFKEGQNFGFKYPVDSKVQLCKLYLYSITSHKNGFQINIKQFLAACQKFGFDSPFPFLHVCQVSEFKFEPDKDSEYLTSQAKTVESVKVKQTVPVINQINETIKSNVLTQKIQIGSILFSQHFSILRQLREYCTVFRQTLNNEKNPEKLWVQFGRIVDILDRGCTFLKFPLKV